MAEKKKEVQLKVTEAIQDDVNKGIVRIDKAVLNEIGLSPGDIVEIEGKRKTVAIADRSYPGDIGLGIIRMDGIIRRNAGTSVGEYVKVRKAEVKTATRIVLAPARKGVYVQAPPNLFKQALIGRAVVKGDIISLGGHHRRRRTYQGPFGDIFSSFFEDFASFGLGDIKWIVVSTQPKDAVIITDATEIEISPEAVEPEQIERVPEVTYEDIGGLDEEIKRIREMVELPMKHPEIFSRLGIEPPKGVLLYGPPGTGKTLLAKAVANESNANFISVAGPEIMSKYYGESEKRIRDIFAEAEKNAPSIIFIDEIDAIAPKREETRGEVERRVVSQLLTMMDGLKTRGKVVVIAATNRPNDIDPALRRPGRFDREIRIGVPNREGRLQILKIHTRNMPLAKDVNLQKLAEITHGYVGADLAALAKEAAMIVLRRVMPEILTKKGEEKQLSEETLEKLKVTMKDFREALKIVRPSAMREVLVEIPNVKWSDIGGLEDIKQQLKEAIEWPLKKPQMFKRLGIRPPKGILLYGAPGTGKTLLAKAIANESNANFILVKGPELLSMYVGESEKRVRQVFERAREVAPAIIFFDEIDSLAPRRGLSHDSHVTERVVNQLLTELDGLVELENVVVIAATNRPDIVDTALLRPGRFDRMIYIPVPDKETRLEIIKIHTKNMPLAKDVSLQKLAEITHGYVGADLEAVCREAAMIALRENINAKEVRWKHFQEALKVIGPSASKEIEETYKQFENQLKAAHAKAMQVEKPAYFG